MALPAQKVVLRLSGLHLPRDELFSTPETARKIYPALVGDKFDLPVDELRKKAEQKLLDLFTVLLDHSEMFVALRDHPATWETVSAEWEAYTAVSPADMRELAEVITTSRRNYNGSRPATKFNLAVDKWIAITDRIGAMPSPQQFHLPHHPNPAWSSTPG